MRGWIEERRFASHLSVLSETDRAAERASSADLPAKLAQVRCTVGLGKHHVVPPVARLAPILDAKAQAKEATTKRARKNSYSIIRYEPSPSLPVIAGSQ
jgi:hypothetical protein